MTRQFIRATCMIAFFLMFTAVSSGQTSQPAANPKKLESTPQSTQMAKSTPNPPKDQVTNIPYFSLRDGMSSTLTLNNLMPSPMTVTVTLFSMQGRGQVLDPIELDPASIKQIDLA